MSQPYNPYAAPAAPPPGFAPPPGGQGQPVPWEPGEVLNLAWARFKTYWPVLVLGYFVTAMIGQLISQPAAFYVALNPTMDPTMASVIRATSTGASMVLGVFFMVGMIRVFLEAARGRTPSFAGFFMGGDRFAAMLGLYFLMSLIIVVGLVCLVVPGIIAMLGLSFAPFYLVDQNLGPIEAMKASWEATKGQRGKIFGLGALCALVGCLGFLACFVGIFGSFALVYLATAIAYTRVSGRDVAMPEVARAY